MFDTSRYTIGWICAIPTEVVAARLHLDAEHDASEYEAALNDDNTYVFGSIGRHNIVIAALPYGEYGTCSAASVARDLIRSFTNVRIGLMVGIGGGAPLIEPDEKRRQDIRLGDVVVSSPGSGKGGVYQYDYGKAVQGQGFLLTGHLNSPPTSLRAAMTILDTDFSIYGHNIDEDVATILAKHGRIRATYQRPDATTDRLYRSCFIHPDIDESCSVHCNVEEQVSERVGRNDDEIVVVHYGLIASANTVMKDALIRDGLARQFGVLCFEMEAAGLMNQLPFLVIRGICDYSDSHKTKTWQGYAAMTAAAYTKKLLLRLSAGKVEAEGKLSEIGEIKEAIQHVSRQIDLIQARVETNGTQVLRKEIEEWLKAPDQSTNHNSALKLCYEGTGSWVLNSTVFLEWRRGEHRLLWLQGISGSGKTVLASTVIKHLHAIENGLELVLYFYFDVRDERKQCLDDVLRSLIKQLYSTWHTGRSHLEQLYGDCGKSHSQATTTQLNHCFIEICKDKQIVIVLDALDECRTHDNSRSEVLGWLKSVSHLAQLVVTSRPEHDIKMGFAEWVTSSSVLEIKGKSHDDDIKAFVHFSIHDKSDQLKRWRTRPGIQQEMETNLVNGADGMFRWVVCQLDVLRKCVDPPTLRRALHALPKGLNATYDRIISSIHDEHRSHVVRILQFLVYSRQPLQLEELVDIIIVHPERTPAFSIDDRMPEPLELAWCCGSLVRVVKSQLSGGERIESAEPKPQTRMELQLAHASVREYLLLDRPGNIFNSDLQESRANAQIVQTSLAYLYQAMQNEREVSEGVQLPFKDFAARHWIKHASSGEKEGQQVLDWIERVFTQKDFYEYWSGLADPDPVFRPGGARFQRPSALYYASCWGLISSAGRLADLGADLRREEGWAGNALNAALETGKSELVKLLIAKGARFDSMRRYNMEEQLIYTILYRSAEIIALLLTTAVDATGQRDSSVLNNTLCIASYSGRIELVKLLLDMGADINVVGCYRGCALDAASGEGHIEIVKLLLDAGAEVNAAGDNRGALRAASGKGHINIVQLLLARGANVLPSSGGALPRAAAGGHVAIVELLLARGADVNERCKSESRYGGEENALRAACMQGNVELAKLLLDHGADVNWAARAPPGNAIYHASSNGHIEIVKLLLDNGANIKSKGYWDQNALEVASQQGHIEIVKLFLAQATIGLDLGSAVVSASQRNHIAIVRLLLDKGISIKVQAKNFDRSLRAASKGGHTRIVKLMLDQGADVNAQEKYFPTALSLASGRGYIETVKLLLDQGAEVNARAGYDGTALCAASSGGHLEIVRLLLSHGAINNMQPEKHGTSALCVASKNGHAAVVRLLLNESTDADGRLEDYGDAFAAASSRGQVEVVKLLLEQRPNVVSEADHFTDGLLAASSHGRIEIVRLLLDWGVNVNTQSESSGSALQQASRSHHTEIMKLLLDRGADINTRSEQVESAIQIASRDGHAETVKLLLDRGADVHTQSERCPSAIQTTSCAGQVEILKLLLDRDIDLNTQGGCHDGILSGSSYVSHAKTIRLLQYEHDGDSYIGIRNFCRAFCAGSVEQVKQLLVEDVSFVTRAGVYDSALRIASHHGHTEVTKLLEEYITTPRRREDKLPDFPD